MSYPSPPEIATSYTAVEQGLGNGAFPGQEVDVDLAAVRASITAIIEFLKIGLRSDGKLNNGAVTKDSLSSGLIIGLDTPAPWATATAYKDTSLVFQGFGLYLCRVPHTSTVFATDLASGRWQLVLDLTPPGGALIASNNLSDLPSKSAARTNLQLGTMATVDSGTGAAQFRTNLQNEAFFQPLAATLTSWAAITRAAGFDTFAATPSSANLRALLSDESGSGALLFAGADMGTPAAINLANATGLTTAGIAAGSLTTSGETIGSNVSDTQVPTSAAVDAHIPAKLNASGSAPIFANRAWGNFSSVPASGTYSRTGTLVTVTLTAHGMTTGQFVNLDFTTGTATDGWYAVTVVDANTFTVTDSASGATSGNVTRQIWLRAGGNISSITDNGVGNFTVNFTTALPDVGYGVNVNVALPSVGNGTPSYATYGTKTTSSVVILTGLRDAGASVGADYADTSFSVVR